MKLKWFIAAFGVLGWCGTASAQLFGQPGSGGYYGPSGLGPNGGFMPNIYNPQSQPLSPYLNMFRGGGNPAANYYFGTRPGTVGGMGMGMGGAPNIAFGGPRGLFFPELATGADPLELPPADPLSATALPPAGHPVFFNNTMGYYPSPFGNRFGMGGGMRGPGGNMGRPQTAGPRR